MWGRDGAGLELKEGSGGQGKLGGLPFRQSPLLASLALAALLQPDGLPAKAWVQQRGALHRDPSFPEPPARWAGWRGGCPGCVPATVCCGQAKVVCGRQTCLLEEGSQSKSGEPG